MSNMFDPAMFLEATINEANSTESIPVPVGEYVATITDVKARKWQAKDQSSEGIALDVLWEIDDADVKELLGRAKVTVKQGIMLDLNEQGGLDIGKGRNVNLGRLREAVGLNVPGQPFSFFMLNGRPAKVLVEHRANGDQIFAEVKGVTKLV